MDGSTRTLVRKNAHTHQYEANIHTHAELGREKKLKSERRHNNNNNNKKEAGYS